MATTKKEKPKIINLSSKTLSEEHKTILAKGLKFTPTPQRKNINEIQDDISKFTRRLRLAEQLYDKYNDDDSIVRNASNYTPPKGRNKTLDSFCDHVSNFPYETITRPKFKSNCTKSQWDNILELKSDTNIIIKEADKGSAVVVMDIQYYRQLVLKMLKDDTYYETVKKYNSKKIMQKLVVLLNLYRKGLTDKEVDYICNFKCKTSNMYGLPKIHKSKIISEECSKAESVCVNIQSPPDLSLRPIIAGPACETHRLSNFLDILLKPFLRYVDSFVRDDIDMLNHLPKTVSENTLIVSFDVVSLYTNIPHNFGLEAISYWIDHHMPPETPERIPKEIITNGLKFILENNYFTFDSKFYRQISGTAMGTKVAPTYANLVMGYLEIKMYQKVLEDFGNDFFIFIKSNWKRYLDDCFILWKYTLDKLKEFHILLNSINNNIQFTMDYSEKCLPFLDILVIKDHTEIKTDIYYKPTDTKQYLTFNSCHPKHTRLNIPYNLARRLCTIISDRKIRDERLKELYDILMERKYPKTVIEMGIAKAKAIDIQELRQPRPILESKETIAFVSTFNPNNPEVFNTIHQNLPMLKQNIRTKTVLEQFEIIKSKRQPKSLKKLLTSAKFDPGNIKPRTVQKCNYPTCGICASIIEGESFTFKGGQIFQVRNYFTCASENLIYVITCVGCNENYIGQTGMSLRKRMTVHRQQIKPPRNPHDTIKWTFRCLRRRKLYYFPVIQIFGRDNRART